MRVCAKSVVGAGCEGKGGFGSDLKEEPMFSATRASTGTAGTIVGGTEGLLSYLVVGLEAVGELGTIEGPDSVCCIDGL